MSSTQGISVCVRAFDSFESEDASLSLSQELGIASVKIPTSVHFTKHGKPTEKTASFSFDNCYPSSTTQEDVYKKSCRKISDSCMQGSHGCVILFGPAATGKTHTLMGDKHTVSLETPNFAVFTFAFILAPPRRESSLWQEKTFWQRSGRCSLP